MSSFLYNSIVLNSDMMESIERIKKNTEEGLTYKEELKRIKGFTVGQIFKGK